MGMNVEAPTKGRRRKGVARPEMNVTPLVDVVLVLLIIFMVITPLMHEQFWVHVPDKERETEPAEPTPSDVPPIVVTVNGQGHIQINRDIYPDEVFPERLRRMLVASGDRKIYFDAADGAPFDRVMRVMDLARGGGAAHIAVMTERLQ
jgi:biopolymer transport protein ExbD